MNAKKTAAALYIRVFGLLLALGMFVSPVMAGPVTQGGGVQVQGGPDPLDTNVGGAIDTETNFYRRNPNAKQFAPTQEGGSDVIQNKESVGPGVVTVGPQNSGPAYSWPVSIPTIMSPVRTKRDEAITKSMLKTTGYMLSDTQYQAISRYNFNRFLEQLSDPQRWMWMMTAMGGMQSTSAANSTGSMASNQAQTAIGFVKSYLTNFTAEPNNVWQAIRDQLFIPMAVLLLLPGAVLAQVRAIVAQGSPILGDINPFEGIIRSIIAIVLIPGTFLVINYGIDVANSITYTIADEYRRIFGTDMYDDATCGQIRAFAGNSPNAVRNAILPNNNVNQGVFGGFVAQGGDPEIAFEKKDYATRILDVCAGIDQQVVADEDSPWNKQVTRFMLNGGNAALAQSWNVMCAFQMVYLYYLWCMGPIAAALWVWPIGKMRSALPSWCEGVIVLCFWSLFWNTVILLMACFRGVGETGTIIFTALNSLALYAVQFAFDFSSLVSQGASQGVQQALQSMMQGAQQAATAGGASGGPAAAGRGRSGAGGGGGGGRAAGQGRQRGAGAGAQGAPGATMPGAVPGGGLNGQLTSATAQNMHSPLLGGANLTAGGPGGHGAALPGSAGMPGAFSASAGLGSGLTGAGTTGAPGSAGTLAGLSAPPLAASLTGTNSMTHGLNASTNSAATGGLGMHLDQSGHLQMNQEAMNKLQNQLGGQDPNKALANALAQDKAGNHQPLQDFLKNAQAAGVLDPTSANAINSMALNGMTPNMGVDGNLKLNPNDASTLAANSLIPTAGPNGTLADNALLNQGGPGSNLPAIDPLTGAPLPPGVGNLALGPDGNLVPGGALNPGAGNLALGPDGNLVPGGALNPGAGNLALGPDGNLVPGGALTAANLTGGPLSPDGITNPALTQGTGFPMTDAKGLPLSSNALDLANNPNAMPGIPGQGMPGQIPGAPDGMTQGQMSGLSTLAQQEHAGQLSFRDAQTGQPVSDLNSAQHAVQAYGANGQSIAQYDPSSHTWTAAGTSGQVTMGADNQWHAGGTNGAAVTADANGNFSAAGTNFAYNAQTNSFDVNGSQLPASSVGGDMLRDFSNHVPAAEATMQALTHPGVAQNLDAAIRGDSQAMQAVQSGLQGTGVNAESLYSAAHGNALSAASVMGQEASVNSPQGQAYAQSMSQQLGVPESMIKDAGSNPLSAASVLSAEAKGNDTFAREVASHLPAGSDQLIAQAGSNPVAAAQLVGMEARADANYGAQVAPSLHLPSADMVQQMGSNPVLAAQAVGAEALSSSTYASAVSGMTGYNAETIQAAATSPTVAASLVGLESRNADYGNMVAQSLPHASAQMIAEAANSPLAATQLAAAAGVDNPSYGREIVGPAMSISQPEHLAAVSSSPVAAAAALSAELRSASPELSSTIANSMHVAPSVLENASSSYISAAQVVASDAVAHPGYGAIAADAMHTSQQMFEYASHSSTAAAQVLASEARGYEGGTQHVASALHVAPEVVAQAAAGNAVAAAQMVAADAVMNGSVNSLAYSTHVSPDVINQAVTNQGAAAQLMAAEASRSDANYFSQVASDLHMAPAQVAEAAYRPDVANAVANASYQAGSAAIVQSGEASSWGTSYASTAAAGAPQSIDQTFVGGSSVVNTAYGAAAGPANVDSISNTFMPGGTVSGGTASGGTVYESPMAGASTTYGTQVAGTGAVYETPVAGSGAGTVYGSNITVPSATESYGLTQTSAPVAGQNLTYDVSQNYGSNVVQSGGVQIGGLSTGAPTETPQVMARDLQAGGALNQVFSEASQGTPGSVQAGGGFNQTVFSDTSSAVPGSGTSPMSIQGASYEVTQGGPGNVQPAGYTQMTNNEGMQVNLGAASTSPGYVSYNEAQPSNVVPTGGSMQTTYNNEGLQINLGGTAPAPGYAAPAYTDAPQPLGSNIVQTGGMQIASSETSQILPSGFTTGGGGTVYTDAPQGFTTAGSGTLYTDAPQGFTTAGSGTVYTDAPQGFTTPGSNQTVYSDPSMGSTQTAGYQYASNETQIVPGSGPSYDVTQTYGSGANVVQTGAPSYDVNQTFAGGGNVVQTGGPSYDVTQTYGSGANVVQTGAPSYDVNQTFGSAGNVVQTGGPSYDVNQTFGGANVVQTGGTQIANNEGLQINLGGTAPVPGYAAPAYTDAPQPLGSNIVQTGGMQIASSDTPQILPGSGFTTAGGGTVYSDQTQGFTTASGQTVYTDPNQGFTTASGQTVYTDPNQGFTTASGQTVYTDPNQGFTTASSQTVYPDPNQGFTTASSQTVYPDPNQGFTTGYQTAYPDPNTQQIASAPVPGSITPSYTEPSAPAPGQVYADNTTYTQQPPVRYDDSGYTTAAPQIQPTDAPQGIRYADNSGGSNNVTGGQPDYAVIGDRGVRNDVVPQEVQPASTSGGPVEGAPPTVIASNQPVAPPHGAPSAYSPPSEHPSGGLGIIPGVVARGPNMAKPSAPPPLTPQEHPIETAEGPRSAEDPMHIIKQGGYRRYTKEQRKKDLRDSAKGATWLPEDEDEDTQIT